MKKEITTGTKKFEQVFTTLTNVLQIAPKLPIDDYREDRIPRIGIAKFKNEFVPKPIIGYLSYYQRNKGQKLYLVKECF